MLVIGRRTREQIEISGGITITVLAIHGGVVKLGVEAPAAIRVYRQEVVRRDPGLAASLAAETVREESGVGS
jgi:carbon storage regulator